MYEIKTCGEHRVANSGEFIVGKGPERGPRLIGTGENKRRRLIEDLIELPGTFEIVDIEIHSEQITLQWRGQLL